jgi:formylglycine-generating enzyme required for sulfatase activity
MLEIPAGRFMMGDADEVDAAPHEVSISGFYLDKYLVTQEQFQI